MLSEGKGVAPAMMDSIIPALIHVQPFLLQNAVLEDSNSSLHTSTGIYMIRSIRAVEVSFK